MIEDFHKDPPAQLTQPRHMRRSRVVARRHPYRHIVLHWRTNERSRHWQRIQCRERKQSAANIRCLKRGSGGGGCLLRRWVRVCAPRESIWSSVLTDGSKNGGGVVEGPGKFPLLAGLVRDSLQHHRLQQLVVIPLDGLVELLLDLCKAREESRDQSKAKNKGKFNASHS